MLSMGDMDGDLTGPKLKDAKFIWKVREDKSVFPSTVKVHLVVFTVFSFPPNMLVSL